MYGIMELKKVVNFIYELNHLKLIKHHGWLKAGVKDPDSVAEHAWRAAQIGYILAVMEGDVNPDKVATMVLIHDNGEARIGDQDKVGARYYKNHDAEARAVSEQLDCLGNGVKEKWQAYFDEYENRNTKEGIIAKDADWLEQAFQAKQYVDTGYTAANEWIVNVEKAVETESAKKLLAAMKDARFTDWYKELTTMTYKKLEK